MNLVENSDFLHNNFAITVVIFDRESCKLNSIHNSWKGMNSINKILKA